MASSIAPRTRVVVSEREKGIYRNKYIEINIDINIDISVCERQKEKIERENEREKIDTVN